MVKAQWPWKSQGLAVHCHNLVMKGGVSCAQESWVVFVLEYISKQECWEIRMDTPYGRMRRMANKARDTRTSRGCMWKRNEEYSEEDQCRNRISLQQMFPGLTHLNTNLSLSLHT